MQRIIGLLQRLAGSREKKILVGNFVSLSGLQIANYLLSLATFPYLVRVLGPEQFGLIAFAGAFIQYFVIFTDYGFNLSATREISVHRQSPDKVAEIFNAVMLLKMIFAAVSFLVLGVVLSGIGRFQQDRLVYLYAFGTVIGSCLFPVWFFQGIEQMKYIVQLNLLCKLIFTAAVFVFVRSPADVLHVPLITSAGYIVSGAMALGIACRKFNVPLRIPPPAAITEQLHQGWTIFISSVAMSVYSGSNTVILGFFADNTIVGYYAGAEKIIRVVQSFYQPASQALYPYVSSLAHRSQEQAVRFLGKVLALWGATTLAASLALFVCAPWVVGIILGAHYQPSIVVLRIMAFLPFIVGLSIVFGVQTMLAFNLKAAFSKILVAALFVNVALAFAFAPLWRQVGVAVAAVISETLVTGTMLWYLSRRKLIDVSWIRRRPPGAFGTEQYGG